jgi:hypothetical protein
MQQQFVISNVSVRNVMHNGSTWVPPPVLYKEPQAPPAADQDRDYRSSSLANVSYALEPRYERLFVRVSDLAFHYSESFF